MPTKQLIPKIADWVLICVAVVLLTAVYLSNASAASDPLGRQDRPAWHFGEGLNPGDFFQYEICDSILKIPESPDSCYVMTLQFLQLLPSPEGKTWITSVHVDHNVRQIDMIFHISADSFKVKTDGTTIPYAQSLERTLGWIKQHASKFEPQPLVVGKPWSTVASDAGAPSILLTQIDSFQLGNQTHQTYRLGYYLVKDSFIQIKDEFPFPMQAVIYKPISSHHDIPLAFTVRLLSFWNSNHCLLVFDEKVISTSEAGFKQNSTTLNDTGQHDELLDGDSDGVFSIISTEEEIAQIEGDKNDENHTQVEDYKKIEQLFGNFTGFLQILSERVNQIMENQTK